MGFKASLAKAQQRIENMQARANQCCCNSGSSSIYAASMLNQIFSNMAYAMSYNYSTASTGSTAAKKTSEATEEVEVLGNRNVSENSENIQATQNNSEAVLTKDEKRKKVTEIIQKQFPNFTADNEFIDDLVSKYDLYKSCHEYWTDEYVEERLVMYYKALEHNKAEKAWGEIAASNATMTGANDIIVDDSEISEGISQNENGQISDKYLDSITERGVGYLDLYDENVDGVVTLQEFINREQRDFGEELTPEMEAETKKYFDRIDQNHSGGIDAKEMASHLYAVSRLYDFDPETNAKVKNSENDISYMEWYGAQTPAPAIEQRLTSLAGEFFEAVKNR